MKSPFSFVRKLQITALILLLSGLGVWIGHGARLGWTQTSVVTLQHDELTGIDFPVRRDNFVAGIEVPVLATVLALGIAGLGALAQRRSTPRTARIDR